MEAVKQMFKYHIKRNYNFAQLIKNFIGQIRDQNNTQLFTQLLDYPSLNKLNELYQSKKINESQYSEQLNHFKKYMEKTMSTNKIDFIKKFLKGMKTILDYDLSVEESKRNLMTVKNFVTSFGENLHVSPFTEPDQSDPEYTKKIINFVRNFKNLQTNLQIIWENLNEIFFNAKKNQDPNELVDVELSLLDNREKLTKQRKERYNTSRLIQVPDLSLQKLYEKEKEEKFLEPFYNNFAKTPNVTKTQKEFFRTCALHDDEKECNAKTECEFIDQYCLPKFHNMSSEILTEYKKKPQIKWKWASSLNPLWSRFFTPKQFLKNASTYETEKSGKVNLYVKFCGKENYTNHDTLGLAMVYVAAVYMNSHDHLIEVATKSKHVYTATVAD